MLGNAMKSLFRSGARELKDKFSNDEDEDEVATPYNLRIGGAVDIDTLPMRMHVDQLRMRLPEETLIIAAQGYIELGDGGFVHRYYAANDSMIQVLTINGVKDQHVEEITLFTPFKSYYPSDRDEWAKWTAKDGRIGRTTFTLDDGTEYDRIWFDDTTSYAEPVAYSEFVYEDPESDDHDEIHHKAMLYGRNLEADKKNEYLLVSAESYDNEKTVEVMIGVDLELAMMKII